MFIAKALFRRLAGAFLAPLIGVALMQLGSVGTTASGAGIIYDSKGFENPPFATGNLASQDGWVGAGFNPGSTATVQNTVVMSGAQALTTTRAAAPSGDQRWLVPTSGYPTQRFVTVDWDMRVEGPAGPGDAFGPFFGVDTYDANNGIFVLGSLGIDATTGEILYQQGGTGFLTAVPSVTVPFGSWNHYRIVMDFATDTYHGFVNGASVVPGEPFVDDTAAHELDDFTDADIATFAAFNDAISLSRGGTAQYDNFLIRDGLLGDYNIDGTVDAGDYATWRNSFGNIVSPAGNGADGNKNGIVDAADFVTWRDNLGTSLLSGVGAGAVSLAVVVPEPAGMILLLMAIPAVHRRRSLPR